MIVAEGASHTTIDVVDCVFPQPFVAVRVMVSVPSALAAEYVTEMVPLLVPLTGEKALPIEDESDQLVAFATVKVMVAVSPVKIAPGDTPSPVIVGSGFTVTFALPVFEHPAPIVTMAESCTGPVAPALQVIARVPAPPVIVPFVIVQA